MDRQDPRGPGDGVGDSQIEFIAGGVQIFSPDSPDDSLNAGKGGTSDLEATGIFGPDEAGTQSARDFAGELQILDFDPDKTIFDPTRRPFQK